MLADILILRNGKLHRKSSGFKLCNTIVHTLHAYTWITALEKQIQ